MIPLYRTASSDLVHFSISKTFKVFDQNIRGIMDETNELINSLLLELRQILYITEHQNMNLKEQENSTII
jgi:hypothetical protein